MRSECSIVSIRFLPVFNHDFRRRTMSSLLSRHAVPTTDRLHTIFALVERAAVERFGLVVEVCDVPAPFTGDLDGATIWVDYELPPGERLFVLLHLVGHSIQWNVSADAREVGLADARGASEALLVRVEAYERDAGRYALQLLHDLGVRDLDAWLAVQTHADIAYLFHFYRTGEKRDPSSFLSADAPALAPLPIPAFVPTRWLARNTGVVI